MILSLRLPEMLCAQCRMLPSTVQVISSMSYRLPFSTFRRGCHSKSICLRLKDWHRTCEMFHSTGSRNPWYGFLCSIYLWPCSNAFLKLEGTARESIVNALLTKLDGGSEEQQKTIKDLAASLYVGGADSVGVSPSILAAQTDYNIADSRNSLLVYILHGVTPGHSEESSE